MTSVPSTRTAMTAATTCAIGDTNRGHYTRRMTTTATSFALAVGIPSHIRYKLTSRKDIIERFPVVIL